MDTELQDAADQAALAGATQLDQQDGAIDRATSAARGDLVRNLTLFANDGGGNDVEIPEGDVYFYATQADAEAGTNALDPDDEDSDVEAAFIRVAVETRTANYALTPVVGAISGSLNAEAVAGLGSALCRTPPLMICNPSEPTSNGDTTLDFDVDAHIGQGLLVKGGGGASWAPGNFGYLDTIPGSGGGTPELLRALGWTAPPGNCVSQSGNVTVDMETGNHAAVADAVNTRFDIYNGNTNSVCPSPGSCPASIDSVKDVVHPPRNAGDSITGQQCRLHNQGWQEVAAAGRYLPSSNAALPTTSTPSAMGHPRDICHSTDPKACSGPFGDAFWDRDAYFRSHYVRSDGTSWSAAEWRSNLAANGFTATIDGVGVSRPTRPTRYQVYAWEIANQGTTIDGVTILGARTVGSNSSYGTPVCSSARGYGTGTVPSEFVADRRRLSVAIVNCAAYNVRGSSVDIPVRRWVDVFLVQPSLDRGRTQKDEMYVEIIGETEGGSAGETAGTVIRRDVPFLVR